MSAFFCAEFSAQGVRNTQSLCIFGIYDYTERPLTLGHSLQHSNTPFNTRTRPSTLESSIFTPRKHKKISFFSFFRNFRATARSRNATDQSRACKIRIFFRLLQLFIQLRGSGTGSKNHPATRFGDWIKKCIQVLKRPCVFGNALTRDNV